jgi:hypothetical protein
VLGAPVVSGSDVVVVDVDGAVVVVVVVDTVVVGSVGGGVVGGVVGALGVDVAPAMPPDASTGASRSRGINAVRTANGWRSRRVIGCPPAAPLSGTGHRRSNTIGTRSPGVDDSLTYGP